MCCGRVNAGPYGNTQPNVLRPTQRYKASEPRDCINDKTAEDKELASVLLIDLTAAYDTIDHQILQRKLEAYNFGSGIRRWIGSYLEGRTQSVEVSGTRSLNRFLGEYGALQGSIMAGLP